MEEKVYKVYIHTNKINNMVYVGLTKQRPKKRWKNGKGYRFQPTFYSAIKKYGWGNFTHEVLVENLTKEEGKQYEAMLIKRHDSSNRYKGYNINSESNEGWKMCEETRKKMSVAKTGENHPKSNRIICINTLEVFESSNLARIKYGIKSKNISSTCKGIKKSCGKHPITGEKLHWMYYEDYKALKESSVA